MEDKEALETILNELTSLRKAIVRERAEGQAITTVLETKIERLKYENTQLLIALRDLHDFSSPLNSGKYHEISVTSFDNAAKLLYKLEPEYFKRKKNDD